MKKWMIGLSLFLVMVACYPLASQAGAPDLVGTWVGTVKSVGPDGTVGSFQITDLQINATSDPTLFYGTLTGPEADPNFITIMMDAGAKMHFTISVWDSELGEQVTRTTGRGTANAKKIVGSWSDDRGQSGNFVLNKK